MPGVGAETRDNAEVGNPIVSPSVCAKAVLAQSLLRRTNAARSTATAIQPAPARLRRSRSAALFVVGALLLAGCGIGSDSINVDSPTLATNVEGAEPDSNAADGGSERIIAPDFEVDLEPGQDPDDVLGPNGPGDESTDDDQPESPGGAILTLCPALEAVISQTSGADLTDELEALRAGTPTDLHDKLDEVMADPTRVDLAGIEALDTFYLAACSAPLSAGALQVAAACGGGIQPTSVLETIEALGGLCFDDDGQWLSCVSGLPVEQS